MESERTVWAGLEARRLAHRVPHTAGERTPPEPGLAGDRRKEMSPQQRLPAISVSRNLHGSPCALDRVREGHQGKAG